MSLDRLMREIEVIKSQLKTGEIKPSQASAISSLIRLQLEIIKMKQQEKATASLRADRGIISEYIGGYPDDAADADYAG